MENPEKAQIIDLGSYISKKRAQEGAEQQARVDALLKVFKEDLLGLPQEARKEIIERLNIFVESLAAQEKKE